MVKARERLEGAVVRCEGGAFLTVHFGISRSHSDASKKIPMSKTGDPNDNRDMTDSDRQAMKVESVRLEIGVLNASHEMCYLRQL